MAGFEVKPPTKLRKPEPPSPSRRRLGRGRSETARRGRRCRGRCCSKAFETIFWMQVRSAVVCAAVSVGGLTVVEIVWPPSLTVSVIFGTVPLSCRASRERAPTAALTPGILATSLIGDRGEGEERAGHEEVVGELRPGLAELGEVGDDRGVVVEQGRGLRAVGAAEPATPRAKNPPPPPPPPPAATGERHRRRTESTAWSSSWWSARWSARQCGSR